MEFLEVGVVFGAFVHPGGDVGCGGSGI